MTLALAVTLFGLGLLGAFVAGMLGVGGAIIMIPLLLYVPPLLSVGRIDIKGVAAITMTQVLVAAVSGMLAHRRHGAVHTKLAFLGGLAMATGSLVGALGSKFVQDEVLLVVFGLMTTGASFLIFMPTAGPTTDVTPAEFSWTRAAIVAGGVGLAAGLVGAGGAFLLVPLLLVVVRIPIRVTIGSSLAITAVAACAGFVGKLVTGQIPFASALAVVLGAIPGAQLGAAVSRRLPPRVLRAALFVFVLLTAIRVWVDLFSRRARDAVRPGETSLRAVAAPPPPAR